MTLYQQWTTGLPFSYYLDETNKVIYPDDAEYKTLWPDNIELTEDDKKQIIDNFYNRITNQTPPQYWLRRFHALVRRESYKWRKLLDSEKALRDEDSIYNYDLTEESEYSSNTQNNSSGNSESNGTTSSTVINSETPENSVDDIDSFMSSASKNSTSSNGSGNSSSNTTQTSGGTTRLTRKGNIGVMTAGQIIGGYRNAIKYCAFDDIFRELEPMFLGVWEVETYGEFYPTI